MESGGVIAEAGWSVVGMPSQAEESEIMEQLLGTFPSNCEEGDQELPWSIQASSAFYSHCNAPLIAIVLVVPLLLCHLNMGATI